jgi:tRNA threonylcarbamoyladenosine biosynthesis protein TsaB
VNVLALDGALGVFSAAVARDDSISAAQSEAGSVALERGLTLVESVLEATRLEPAQLDRLAVGIGPGGFTGLRIAIAYAKSLAVAWERPLVPLSSFDLLEFGRRFERVLSVVVGRPGVISARYRSDSQSRRASGRIAEVLDALFPPLDRRPAGATADDKLDVVGAAKDVLDALAERGIIVRSFEPAVTPAAAAAALSASSRTPAKSVHEVRADYGELPAAKPPRF